MKTALQAGKYALVGVLNTAVGLSIIYACMAGGLGDITSNAIGYGIGIMVSYAMNSRWTFEHTGRDAPALLRFLVVVGVAYSANIVALLLARDGLGLNSHVAQLFGIGAYVLVGFIGSRRYAFAF